MYAWYFKEVPLGVPTGDCVRFDDLYLLYVGIAPKPTPANGKPASRQSLFHRVRYHYLGNAEGSTLRLTLGCLLSERLEIQLRRVGSGKRLTFGRDGESILSAWMADNAFVAWWTQAEPWLVERQTIGSISLPLNLDQNRAHHFHAMLSEKRRTAKATARSLPILN